MTASQYTSPTDKIQLKYIRENSTSFSILRQASEGRENSNFEVTTHTISTNKSFINIITVPKKSLIYSLCIGDNIGYTIQEGHAVA
jgi:hypothetical protein